MKVVEENFCQLLQKVLCLWHKELFVYIDEDFAINLIRPKFLSLLMTGKSGAISIIFEQAIHRF